MNSVKIWVDGSYSKDYNIVSGGVVSLYPGSDIPHKSTVLSEDAVFTDLHNVGGELLAVMYGVRNVLDSVPDLKIIDIYYDYAGIEKWATREWDSNRLATYMYQQWADRIKDGGVQLIFHKVKAHAPKKSNEYDRWNAEADRIAKDAIYIFSCGIDANNKIKKR